MLRYTIISLSFILLSGCVYNVQQPVTERPLSMVNDVPFYPQEEYQCGPASLASVMNYWGVPVTSEEVADKIYSKSARGTLTIDIMLFARSKGLEVSSYRGGLEDLRSRIDAGHPLIVLVDFGFSIVQVNHFMVIVGYNEHGVIVNSGGSEGKFIPNADLLKAWEKTGFTTLLINKVAIGK